MNCHFVISYQLNIVLLMVFGNVDPRPTSEESFHVLEKVYKSVDAMRMDI